MIQKQNSRFRAAFVVLFLLLVIAVPASAQLQLLTSPTQSISGAKDSATFTSTPKSFSNKFTIRTLTSISSSEASSTGNLIWLAGIGAKSGSAPTDLALTWTPTPSWWGFSWVLQLHSESGLLPSSLLKTESKEAVATVVDLLQINPQAGHQYESLLSYNAETGALSVRITDNANDNVLYRNTWATGRVTDSFYATAGLQHVNGNDSDVRSTVDSIEVHPHYLPVGIDWAAGQHSDRDYFIPVLRFERAETIAVQIKTLGTSLPGTIHLLSVAGRQTTEIAKKAAPASSLLLTVPANELPVGRAPLALEYRENDTALLRDAVDITVGVAKFQFSSVEINKETGELKTSLNLSSNGELKGMDVGVNAILDEYVWNETAKNYGTKTVSATTLLERKLDIPDGNPTVIPLMMPLPKTAGYYRVRFEPVAVQSIGVIAEQTEQRFQTYAPAKLVPGEAFTIAVLPDTQYYAQSHPEILTRQTQWIAEQADVRNIVLALQLGDITNNNIPGQWLNAQESFKMLDDVMPFVLAQGNHDLRSDNGDFANRSNSLINNYFPVSRFPWITGTFEKNRVENSYSLFTFQDKQYLILSLEFGPRDEVLAWADKVAAEHRDYKVIMITHNYTGSNGARSSSATGYDLATNGTTTVNAGPGMWSKLVQRNTNFQLVLSGHIHSNAIPRQVGWGADGNKVYEMLMDYQSDPNGGDGYLVLLTFKPDGNIDVQSYSPYLGQNRDQRDQYGYNNQFLIDTQKATFVNH